jgi:hypothetical protein
MDDKKKQGYFLIFILFFITYGYFFQGGGWNQNSKICLVRSIIHHGTFTIDSCREDTPEMIFANTGDYSFYNGHYYSNKSPGHAFLAVPSFALAEYILKHLFPANPELQVRVSSYCSTVCTTGLFSALLSLLIFHFALRFFHMSISDALLIAMFFGFGTLAFSYSTTFYTHQLGACFSFLSFVLILHVREKNIRNEKLAIFLSGTSISFGVLGEPYVFFILGALLIYLTTSIRTRHYIPYFILGAIPAGVVQIFYNVVCFGSPLSSCFQFENEMINVRINGNLFGFPSLNTILNLLILPFRGLFFSSPILIMSLPGFFIGFKSKEFRVEVLFSTIISIIFFLLIASYFGWDGGYTVGPRYILPIYPFLFLVAIFSFNYLPKIFKILGVISIIINLSITVVGNEIPREIKNPLGDVIFINLIRGNVSINPCPLSNYENYTKVYSSVYDFAKVEKWKPNFNSFNLGEIIFPNSLASVLPLICFWVLWFLIWRRYLNPADQ